MLIQEAKQVLASFPCVVINRFSPPPELLLCCEQCSCAHLSNHPHTKTRCRQLMRTTSRCCRPTATICRASLQQVSCCDSCAAFCLIHETLNQRCRYRWQVYSELCPCRLHVLMFWLICDLECRSHSRVYNSRWSCQRELEQPAADEDELWHFMHILACLWRSVRSGLQNWTLLCHLFAFLASLSCALLKTLSTVLHDGFDVS